MNSTLIAIGMHNFVGDSNICSATMIVTLTIKKSNPAYNIFKLKFVRVLKRWVQILNVTKYLHKKHDIALSNWGIFPYNVPYFELNFFVLREADSKN